MNTSLLTLIMDGCRIGMEKRHFRPDHVNHKAGLLSRSSPTPGIQRNAICQKFDVKINMRTKWSDVEGTTLKSSTYGLAQTALGSSRR